MAVYRTAQGKRLDMSMLARRNEKVRAVGNMSVNARGDTIDSQGRVIIPVTKKVGDKYQRTVSNRAAKLAKRKEELLQPIETTPAIETKLDIQDEMELLADELEIDELSEFEVEIEEIKKAELEEKSKKN